ncbi:MAG: zf-HC2 domain-containing protein [Acidobacteriota bacterium]
MNCRRAQDLIPLYVEGDLKPSRALELASHLDSCDVCKGVMDEYAESQQWARAASEPDFDEAFFDDLRESVFARIESEKARPSFFQSVKERILLRPALIATVALIVIAAGMAFYVYSGKTGNDSGKNLVAEEQKEQEEQTVAPPEKEEKPIIKPRPYRPRKPDARAAKATRSKPSAEQLVAKNTDRTRLEWKTKEVTNLSEGMTRIEFHTSDPNIRIIWFAPKEADSKQSKPITD